MEWNEIEFNECICICQPNLVYFRCIFDEDAKPKPMVSIVNTNETNQRKGDEKENLVNKMTKTTNSFNVSDTQYENRFIFSFQLMNSELISEEFCFRWLLEAFDSSIAFFSTTTTATKFEIRFCSYFS